MIILTCNAQIIYATMHYALHSLRKDEQYGKPMANRSEEHEYVPHAVEEVAIIVSKEIGARGIECSFG